MFKILYLLIALDPNGSAYVLDSGLTRAECDYAVTQGVTSINVTDSVVVYGTFTLSCEEE